MEDDDSLSSFLCEENDSCLDHDEEEEKAEALIDHDSISNSFLTDHCVQEEDGEYIRMLLDRETSSGWFGGDPQSNHLHHSDRLYLGDWIKRARFSAFSWILRTRASFGFQFQTAYLSMTYFNQFLSRRSPINENEWAIRLLAVACLSLAAKMEEVNVPLLPEFNAKDHSFRCEAVQGMELLVMKTLEWRLEAITPFLFLHFFVPKLINHPVDVVNIAPKAVRYILGMAKENDILDYRPSTIAAAAVISASSIDITKEALGCCLDRDSFSGQIDIDDVFSCYGTMQGLDLDSILNVSPVVPQDPTSPAASPRSSVSVFTSPFVSSIRKRKRLSFDDNDSSCERDAPDNKK
ncbi:hypothetical protein SAY86_003401 [Trapa natans]|uniref:Cyclin-like domain-containing protein n=1 Tax=Trapa natans TaxID=22666 RepID=A0AAN7REW4_TRANT|nr:hypothetical protein SAY86_003401 [Trapa natans]